MIFAFQGHFRFELNGSISEPLRDLLAVDSEWLAKVCQFNLPELARALVLLGPYQASPEIAEPGIPCFLIVGEARTAQATIAVELRNRFRDGRLIRFPDLGDRPHYEEPELIARVLVRELEEIPGRRRSLRLS